MGYCIECFKTYNLQNRLDFSGEYDFVMIDEVSDTYIYPTVISKIFEFLESYNIHREWSKLIPNYGEQSFENLSLEEAKMIEARLPQPKSCIEIVNSKQIVDIIKNDMPQDYEDMLLVIDKLMYYWSKGYYVIETY